MMNNFKRTHLKRKTPLKAHKRLKHASVKILERNGKWRQICLERAQYLAQKYGQIVCEYSGETIRNLTTTADDLDDAWGHHIDGNRNNCTPENCYIVKYKYHSFIEDNNIQVKQEGFEGRK